MQLYALRNQVDALILAEEGEVSTPSGCPHPEDKRLQSNNMGEEPQFWCQDCKTFIKGQL